SAGGVGDALGGRGLAGVEVSHDPDVAGVLKGELASHLAGERGLGSGVAVRQKNGPLGARARYWSFRTGPLRYLPEVTILLDESRVRTRCERWTATQADYSRGFRGSRAPSCPARRLPERARKGGRGRRRW